MRRGADPRSTDGRAPSRRSTSSSERVPGQRHPHVAVGQGTHRGQHVRRLEAARGARRARRHREPQPVELGHQGLAVDVEARERQHVREPVHRVADHVHVLEAGETLPEPVDQPALPGPDLVPLGHHGLERCGRGQRGRHVLEPRDPGVRSVVGRERRPPARALADDEHPDAGRPSPLVGGSRGGGPPAGQVHPSGRRRSVREDGYVVPGGGRGHRVERLQRAHLGVRHLAGHDTGRLPVQRGLEGVDEHVSLGVDGHAVRRTVEVPLPPRTGRQHGRVLHGGVHQAGTRPAAAEQQPEQPEVDGLRARRGEAHLVGAGAEQGGDHLAGVVEQEPGLAPGAVQPQRVGEAAVQGGEQGVTGGRVEGFGGHRVEVCGGARKTVPPGRPGRIRHTAKLPPALAREPGCLSSNVLLVRRVEREALSWVRNSPSACAGSA